MLRATMLRKRSKVRLTLAGFSHSCYVQRGPGGQMESGLSFCSPGKPGHRGF